MSRYIVVAVVRVVVELAEAEVAVGDVSNTHAGSSP
jgi:hypothetical protein